MNTRCYLVGYSTQAETLQPLPDAASRRKPQIRNFPEKPTPYRNQKHNSQHARREAPPNPREEPRDTGTRTVPALPRLAATTTWTRAGLNGGKSAGRALAGRRTSSQLTALPRYADRRPTAANCRRSNAMASVTPGSPMESASSTTRRRSCELSTMDFIRW